MSVFAAESTLGQIHRAADQGDGDWRQDWPDDGIGRGGWIGRGVGLAAAAGLAVASGLAAVPGVSLPPDSEQTWIATADGGRSLRGTYRQLFNPDARFDPGSLRRQFFLDVVLGAE